MRRLDIADESVYYFSAVSLSKSLSKSNEGIVPSVYQPLGCSVRNSISNADGRRNLPVMF